ncbi:MAG TPA: CarD family transcriptional regulator, partial [bacterium]
MLPVLGSQPNYNQLLEAVRVGGRPWVVGPSGAEKAYVLAALADDVGLTASGTALVVTASRDAAERLHDDLITFLPELDGRLLVYPQWSVGPEDGRPSPEVVGERLAVLTRLLDASGTWVIAPVAALLRKIPGPDILRAAAEHVAEGERRKLEDLTGFLGRSGYVRVDLVDARGEFAVRGGILDVFPPQLSTPIRIEWFGDEVESVRAFEAESQRSTQALDAVSLPPVEDTGGDRSILDYLPRGSLLVLDEPDDLHRQARTLLEGPGAADPSPYFEWGEPQQANGVHAGVWPQPDGLHAVSLSSIHGADRPEDEVALRFGGVEAFGGQMKLFSTTLQGWLDGGKRAVIATAQVQRIAEILREHGIRVGVAEAVDTVPDPGQVVAVTAPLTRGFQLEAADLILISDSEMVGWRRRRRRMRFREGVRLYSWSDLNPDDFVVHIHHGIGIYRGFTRLLLNGSDRDYLIIEYAQNDKLYVPTDQINLVQRYIGVEGQPPKIHRLAGAEWEREKKKVKEAAEELARELLQLYARRE